MKQEGKKKAKKKKKKKIGRKPNLEIEEEEIIYRGSQKTDCQNRINFVIYG